MAIPMKREELPAAKTIEDVLIGGDLSKLSTEQRTEYYLRVCNSIGLNPLTRPFEYLTLNGKLTLYARRDAADQLRKINGISIQIISQDFKDGLLSIHVKATDKTGRTDEDLGVVSMGMLKGDAAANNILKAVTKAKRRVSLSISGLGLLDETEVADIPANAKAAPKENPIKPKEILPPHDPETGEVGPHEIANEVDETGKVKWIEYGSKMLACMKSARDKDEVQKWLDLNKTGLDEMEKEAPKVYKRLKAAIGLK